jgi:hypothetical protein
MQKVKLIYNIHYSRPNCYQSYRHDVIFANRKRRNLSAAGVDLIR